LIDGHPNVPHSAEFWSAAGKQQVLVELGHGDFRRGDFVPAVSHADIGHSAAGPIAEDGRSQPA
jgi:hypothetical protein